MSKKQDEAENKELGKLKKEISELRERAYENIYREMIKYWVIGISITMGSILLGFFIIGIFSRFITFPQLDVDLSKFGEIAPDIFTVTIAVSGVITGFVPLCSFFFLQESREHQKELEQDYEQQKKTSKGEKLKLIETIDYIWFVIWHNLRSGILKYTRTFVLFSIFLQLMLMEFYVITTVQEITPLYIIADFIVLMLIITGLFPLINVALYRPALRPVDVMVVERVVTRFVPED